MLPTPFPGSYRQPLRSRFVPGYVPVVPYSGPLEPNEPNQPREPMPVRKKIEAFLNSNNL